MTRPTPLIVDLDGSLLRTDSLHELVAAALPYPLVIAGAGIRLLTKGKAAFKRYLTDRVTIDVDLLPVNGQVVQFLRAQKSAGRRIYLATGADASIAEAMARRFPEFDGTFASDGSTNLTSGAKADLLVREFGAKGYDYVGNARVDRRVWRGAERAYLANAGSSAGPPGWARGIDFAEIIHEPGKPAWRVWAKELRVHQSLKNLLLFLPMLAAHQFDLRTILLLSAGFVVFSLMASSVYLLNDILDLRSDRLHARKSQRPLAAGRILPVTALLVSVLLAAVALVGAFLIGIGFALVLIGYAALTCLYSFWLKRVTLVDVIVLAMLYMVRIVGGAVIAAIELSFWFTAVALFLFISLALVKRFTELTRPAAAGREGSAVPGRGYARSDSALIMPLGIGAGTAVLLLMAIYLQSDGIAALYPSGVFLWLVIPAMFYWIANIWVQAGRGAMHDDPIVFALKNPASLVSGSIMVLLFAAASSPLAELATATLTDLTAR